MTTRDILLLVAAFALLLPMQAQAQTAVCSNTPAAGERIECTEDSNSTNDIEINLQEGVNITTSDADAIRANHQGAGDVTINVKGVSGSNTLSTSGTASTGIEGHAYGKGSVDITVTDVDITTTGAAGRGIDGDHAFTSSSLAPYDGTYNVNVDVRGSRISTTGDQATAIRGNHQGRTDALSKGRLKISLVDTEITTTGSLGDGIFAKSTYSVGDLIADVRNSVFNVAGSDAFGIRLVRGVTSGGPPEESGDVILNVVNTKIDMTHRETGAARGDNVAIEAQNLITGDDGDIKITLRDTTITTGGYGVHGRRTGGAGDIDIKIEGGSITTEGWLAPGVFGYHLNTGDVTIDARNVDITTEGAVVSDGNNYSFGIWGVTSSDSASNVNIDARGGSITTKGASSFGIFGDNRGTGENVVIKTHDGHSITTEGPNAHGIVAYHRGTGDPRKISVTVGGTIETTGDGSQGVRVGTLSAEGNVQRAATFDEEGYRRQTVTVNGSVMGNAAGVFLAGGGRVIIGPKGTLGATSGIAILATGDTPGADPNNDPAIKPKLRVDLNLGGRRVAEALGDNWILNDGGETTIAMNGVVMHDGAMGTTGRRAPNGVWDVWMREEGVTVTDRMGATPADWTITEPAAGVIADRDFSAQDFSESEVRCPEGQTGFPDCMPIFVEEYAPRSAVYESLSGTLFRLDARGLSEEGLAREDSPMWARVSGGGGSFEPDHATVGAEYDINRFSAGAGLNIPLGEHLTGSVSVRAIRGNVDVDAPTGGGEIEADGIGVAVGVSYTEADAYYARGRFSLSRYELDLSSDTRGNLEKDLDARSHLLDLEAGYRLATHRGVDFTPRLWARHSRVDVDNFTDAVDSRVSVGDETRFAGGLGVIAAGRHTVGNGELFLHGSMDLEKTFSGATTSVDVSGEKLSSEATNTRLLLGLGGTYRRGSFSVRVGASAGGPGSDDEFYTGHVRLGWEH